MRRASLGALYGVVVLLAGGCGPAAPLSVHVLEAPPGVDRWEPSGGVVRKDQLWVVNDRDGWIAAYAIPLAAGVNRPTVAHALRVREGLMKWEGVAADGADGVLLLEAMDQRLWRCADPQRGCPGLVEVPHEAARQAIFDATPPFEYVTLEGLAAEGERRLVGVRGYTPKGKRSKDFRAFSRVLTPDGRATYGGRAAVHDGRRYGLSGMALDGDIVWMTWSYEDSKDDSRAGVAGLLARAELGEDGLPGVPRLCRAVEGKPEGVASWGDYVFVVFDNDKARKRPVDPAAFDLEQNQDLAWVWPKSGCPADGPPLL